MTRPLPASVAVYFKIANGVDSDDIPKWFTQDAVVKDEGQTYQGHTAIRKWQRDARQKFNYTVSPVSATLDGDRLKVMADVVGNFPGSPVNLAHWFELTDGKIASLRIG